MRTRAHLSLILSVAAGVLSVSGCNIAALNNLAAPSTDFAPGGQLVPRAIEVGFINNTSARAIFTFGAYDQLDRDGLPANFRQMRLEANSSSASIPQPCRRTFSVGGAELIRRIEENENSPAINVTDPRALVDGVHFSTAPLGDPLEAEPTEGTALGRDVLLGVDFTCDRQSIDAQTGTGILIFTFEEDAAAPGGFRIDFQFFE